MRQQRRRRSLKRRREVAKRKLKMALIATGSVLAVFLIWYLRLNASVNKVPKDVICDNIYIGDVNVSGMKTKEAKKALKEKEKQYQETKIQLVAEEASVEVTLQDLGFGIEKTDKLVEDAVAYGKNGGLMKRNSEIKQLKKEKKVFPLTYAVEDEAVKTVVEKKMPPLKNGAENATIRREDGKFVITEEKKGVTIDIEESVKTIKAYFDKKWKKSEGESIKLVTKVDEPRITKAQLQEIKNVLGSYTTNCGVGGGRVQNIITGAKHINGAVIMPGEVYSANAAMEPYTAENGFAEAGSYENGKVVQTMGGGICQVSSTLYNAVILSELEIVERFAHSMLVNYVEPSMDAAIAGDYKDLKFKNNTDAPIYLEGYVSGGYITFKVYGKETRSATRTIKYESEVVSKTEAGKKFQASGDPIGTLTKASSGYTGMKAKLWKITYENGVEVDRKVVNNSTYRASDAVYNVGTASDNVQAAAIVQNAISSNDEATIKAAIEQAKALIAAENAPTTTPPTSSEEQNPSEEQPTP